MRFMALFLCAVLAGCAGNKTKIQEDYARLQAELVAQKQQTQERYNEGIKDGLAMHLPVFLEKDWSEFSVLSRVYFDFDKDILRDDGKLAVLHNADIIRGLLSLYKDVEILIVGNADERGTDEYNLKLGERRARTVWHAMKLAGVSASMQILSHGEERPVCWRSNGEDCHQSNRNVTLMLRNPKSVVVRPNR